MSILAIVLSALAAYIAVNAPLIVAGVIAYRRELARELRARDAAFDAEYRALCEVTA